MIRSLNAIYLQAPHIRPEQETSFLGFAELWYRGVEQHHRTERNLFFPVLDEMTGEKDIMQANVEQHETFRAGLEAYHDYVLRCLSGEAKYDGKELVRAIDGFAPAFVQHCVDEVPSFVGLRRYGDKLKGFHARFGKEAEKNHQELGILAGAVFLMATHDVEYEGGTHTNFPPIPWVITWGLRNVAWWAHNDWWAFAPCDRWGRMRPLNVPAA